MLHTPAAPEPAVGYQQKPSQPMTRTNLIGTGPERYYLPIENKASPPWQRPNHQQQQQHGVEDYAAYAPRPLPGSIVDLDKILEKCDFSTNKVSSAARNPRSCRPRTIFPVCARLSRVPENRWTLGQRQTLQANKSYRIPTPLHRRPQHRPETSIPGPCQPRSTHARFL